MAKKVDVLAKKQAELNTYVGQANAAISLVTSTVASLGAINENIDAKIREIDEYQAGLAATKSGLTDAKTKNERIIKNFNALLDVE
ncbi:MAG: hypothetical protein IJ298_09605 [Ruminococcus sp.]|nr:hypothetical protein [Ruminococcus sp.]